MAGETNLGALIRSLKPSLIDGVYVFATVASVPDGLAPRMVFQEAEGTTLILLREEAQAHGLSFEFPSRMITLDIHSSLEAVGFMARIATVLAAEGMGVNPVAGFYHDHLFVPEDRAKDAMVVLHKLAAGET
ncbi:ACT domain-containing protein [Litoreibacter janthinus]|uniref:DUF2241 domain-containing protein n=1 Tax=Litoreibacter janthinus TaxID=670154 RepID=A0A1I6GNP2_9RHOB|nr:ACT domain-containing protein [Litoreibacter janthinus]SFR43746.1 hypothetical protein SAMN04488002_1759 [Litoreibacter janthinus]